MPRRYRPPMRRRKAKKHHFLEEAPPPPAYEKAVPPVSSPPPAAPAAAPVPERSAQARHIMRDHTYVRTELLRIGLIVAFIIGGLVITAILRS